MADMTAAEAAKELGIAQQTVYVLCASRQLAHYRMGAKGGSIRIPASALEEYRKRTLVAAKPAGESPRHLKYQPRGGDIVPDYIGMEIERQRRCEEARRQKALQKKSS